MIAEMPNRRINEEAPVLACDECDLLLYKKPIRIGQKAYCPRCNHVLYESKKDSINRSLALAITGLILFIPANLLPILRLKVLGIEHGATMFTGVVSLFQNGMWILSIVVLLASIVIPAIKLLLVFYISLGLKSSRNFPRLAQCMRWHQHMDEWGMLEVYTLGILVAYTKLIGLAQVIPELGLYCFVAVLFIAGFTSTTVDEELYWEKIEAKND